MPISAMPEHLNTKEEIDAAFPDDRQYGDSWFGKLYTRYNKATKTWFAFSYRCTEWWARWRKYPIVLFAAKGRGEWRYEGSNRESVVPVLWNNEFLAADELYVSRIQYYCRWHFAIQWPLMVSFHVYPKAEDVPEYPMESSKHLKGKVWFAYWNHYDADNIYWMITSGYLGRNWK